MMMKNHTNKKMDGTKLSRYDSEYDSDDDLYGLLDVVVQKKNEKDKMLIHMHSFMV